MNNSGKYMLSDISSFEAVQMNKGLAQYLSGRKLLNEITGPCPSLEQYCFTNNIVLERFIECANQFRHPMDWTLHLELGFYLKIVNKQIWDELFFAAASRWVRDDISVFAWVALGWKKVSDTIFLGCKSTSLKAGPVVRRGEVNDMLLSSERPIYQMGTDRFISLNPLWREYNQFISQDHLLT